ncbi:hydantoinase/oxoprolinase N-terminal domain-containing protein [Fusibacter ferrireducens]|uniref:Hydantoinase/oxoprolinase family protein n=1 Tax=Fusibacter ferrireducens TaxID=2785058 RepID=A0ABR9ZUV5_9FIRM|nr:hydantoinase/oxoprolinase family protein [Fusibacter ferrireducens]MBF4693364.1 hydantoinase/oxoprolinase family protein [Fusibacter ferrireducens]
MYRLGIDVGGTNTDAVLIDEALNVIAEIKHPTTNDIYDGILGAIESILEISKIDPKKIHLAMLGTTQCTNAIVERKNLEPIGLLRIGAPATLGVPPLVDWAEDISKVAISSEVIGGGFEYDGKELAAFDTDHATRFFKNLKGKVNSIAISCAFSSIRDEHEKEAARLCKEIMGDDVQISISSEIGSMGLIERENATVLNASLYKVAQKFTTGFSKSLAEHGITEAKVYISQNDGTLMTMAYAQKYPILTIACGPTNSIRGASYLGHLKEAIVIDVGGTTTDIGVIQGGFPRESGVAVTIGGVRTNFRMPDVLSIGLGGGSIVRQKSDGTISIGPDSVGYEITQKALVFGGDTLTTTDIAVKLGMCAIGNPELLNAIDIAFAQRAMSEIQKMIENGIDSMKLSNEDADVILVGGGSIIVPKNLSGTKSVLKPNYFGTANAIGSAISKISGTFEKLIDYEKCPRDTAIESAKKEAIQMAVLSGAIESSVEIIDVEDVPLAYYPGNTNRVKIKAAGDLKI